MTRFRNYRKKVALSLFLAIGANLNYTECRSVAAPQLTRYVGAPSTAWRFLWSESPR